MQNLMVSIAFRFLFIKSFDQKMLSALLLPICMQKNVYTPNIIFLLAEKENSM